MGHSPLSLCLGLLYPEWALILGVSILVGWRREWTEGSGVTTLGQDPRPLVWHPSVFLKTWQNIVPWVELIGWVMAAVGHIVLTEANSAS